MCSSVATFAYAMELSSPTALENFRWVSIRYISSTAYVFTSYLFVHTYVKIPYKIWSLKFFSLAFFPAASLIIFTFHPKSQLIYQQIGLLSLNELMQIDRIIPPLYILYQIYMVNLFALQLGIIFKDFRQRTRLDRLNTVLISAGAIVILATHLLQLSGWRFLGTYSLNYFSYFPASLLVLLGYQRYRLTDIHPIAYSSVFKQMHEAILVIDRNGYMVDCNPAAVKLFAISPIISPGKQFDPKSLGLPCFPESEQSAQYSECRMDISGIPHLVMISPLLDNHRALYGHLVILQNIASQIEAEILREKNIERKVVQKERQRFARELHDSVMQSLHGLIFSAKTGVQFLVTKPEQVRDVLETIIIGVQQALMDMRLMVYELRPDEAQNIGLVEALVNRLDAVEKRVNITATISVQEGTVWEKAWEAELIAIATEALNNALKHSQASVVDVRLCCKQRNFCLNVKDNGQGFDRSLAEKNGGMGLKNMQARANLCGGWIEIDSQPGNGVSLWAIIPLPGLNNHDR